MESAPKVRSFEKACTAMGCKSIHSLLTMRPPVPTMQIEKRTHYDNTTREIVNEEGQERRKRSRGC
jgi:hypothetical protein